MSTEVSGSRDLQPSAAPASLFLSLLFSTLGTRKDEGGWSPHRWWHPGHIYPADKCSWWLCLFQELISVFLLAEEEEVDIHDTQSIPQATPPQLPFSVQSQVISNHFPAALAHSNVIRALPSLTILLHITFQIANAFLPLETPLLVAPGAQVVYSST